MTKSQIRPQVLAKIARLSPAQKAEESKNVVAQLQILPQFQQATNILLYVSTSEEVFTHDLIQECLKTKKVFLPKTNLEKQVLEIYQLTSWDELKVGPHNVLEPSTNFPASLEEMEIVIIPGVAFTRDGKRLGHGKGYYDKFLANENKVHKISLAFGEQMVEDMPLENHDVKMDLVLFAKSA